MKDSTFKVILGALVVVYVLLWMTTPPLVAKQTFTFDLGEIVCMSLSLVYLLEVVKAMRGRGPVELRAKFKRNCLLYLIAGIALKILATSKFAL